MTDEWDDFLDFYRGQFEWYDSKALWNKRLYYTLRVIVLVIAAALPVVVTVEILVDVALVRYILLGATVLLLLSESLLSLTSCERKWQTYRTTAEGLRREHQAFRMRVGPYNEAEEPRKEFAWRVLYLTSEEHRFWRIVTEDDAPSVG